MVLNVFGPIALLASFVVIVLLVRKNVNFGIALLAGSLALGILAFSPSSFLSASWEGLSSKTTMNLAGIVLLISILTHAMGETGQVRQMIEGLRGLSRDVRAVLAGSPAIFGLLPVPAGALISAPMVEEAGEKTDAGPEDKTFLNLWFRHFWFFIYPLFPGLILASEMSGVSVYRLAAIQIPVFFGALVIGLIVLSGISPGHGGQSRGEGKTTRMIEGISPIFVALALSIVVGLPLLLALIAAVLASLLIARAGARKSWKILTEGPSPSLLLAVMAIMLYKGLVESSRVMDEIQGLISAHNIPLIPVIVLLPFLIGLILGSDIGAIGLSFLIILPMLKEITLPLVSLVYVSAFLGYLVSPLHLCVVVTCDYFSVSIRDIYPKLLGGSVFVFLTTIVTLGVVTIL